LERAVEFRLIDYSSTWYRDNVPAVRRGKFLQLVEDGEIELLILSPYELSKYHAQILERYCMLNDIEGRFVKKPDLFQVTGANIEVLGGGHWEIDDRVRRLMLNRESTMYGRFDRSGLAAKVRVLHEFSSYTVLVS
jgi:hypothetical protein